MFLTWVCRSESVFHCESLLCSVSLSVLSGVHRRKIRFTGIRYELGTSSIYSTTTTATYRCPSSPLPPQAPTTTKSVTTNIHHQQQPSAAAAGELVVEVVTIVVGGTRSLYLVPSSLHFLFFSVSHSSVTREFVSLYTCLVRTNHGCIFEA